MKKIEYKVGNVVWAKWAAHQRWPAYISELTADTKSKVKLLFINKNTSSDIYDYTDNLEPFTKCAKSILRNNPELQDAVQAAFKIKEGKSTYEGKVGSESR